MSYSKNTLIKYEGDNTFNNNFYSLISKVITTDVSLKKGNKKSEKTDGVMTIPQNEKEGKLSIFHNYNSAKVTRNSLSPIMSNYSTIK